jgi:hypothetical protein
MKTKPDNKRFEEHDRSANQLFWTLQGGLFLIWISVALWMMYQGRA